MATQNIKAVILIGGPSRGTRFRPLSFKIPKPLFPIGGEPMIYHHIAACAKVPGLKEVLLIGFFDPSLFQNFIQQTEARLKISIKYLREHKALGTGGGIYHFRDWIVAGKPDYFFVLHSDVYTDFHLADLLEVHKAHRDRSHATILGKKVSRDMTSQLGCIVANEKNEVLHYAEKPETFVSDTINCGVYLFDPTVFDRLGEVFQRNHQFDDIEGRDKDIIRLEQDVLSPLAGTGMLFVYIMEGVWCQLKSAGSALTTDALALEYTKNTDPSRLATSKSYEKPEQAPSIIGPVIIHPSAVINPSAKIGPNVSIGPNVVIGSGARVKDSIVLDDVQIKDHACVLNSVIGWRSSIGEWSRVEGGSKVGLEQSFPLRGPKDDIVTILGEDVFVGDEIIIRNCVVLPHKELKGSVRNEIIM